YPRQQLRLCRPSDLRGLRSAGPSRAPAAIPTANGSCHAYGHVAAKLRPPSAEPLRPDQSRRRLCCTLATDLGTVCTAHFSCPGTAYGNRCQARRWAPWAHLYAVALLSNGFLGCGAIAKIRATEAGSGCLPRPASTVSGEIQTRVAGPLGLP